MPDQTEKQFDAALRRRLRALREERGWTAEQMADALGIPAERYRKYERVNRVPVFLLPKVALICDTTLDWIIQGKGPRRNPASVRRLKVIA